MPSGIPTKSPVSVPTSYPTFIAEDNWRDILGDGEIAGVVIGGVSLLVVMICAWKMTKKWREESKLRVQNESAEERNKPNELGIHFDDFDLNAAQSGKPSDDYKRFASSGSSNRPADGEASPLDRMRDQDAQMRLEMARDYLSQEAKPGAAMVDNPFAKRGLLLPRKTLPVSPSTLEAGRHHQETLSTDYAGAKERITSRFWAEAEKEGIASTAETAALTTSGGAAALTLSESDVINERIRDRLAARIAAQRISRIGVRLSPPQDPSDGKVTNVGAKSEVQELMAEPISERTPEDLMTEGLDKRIGSLRRSLSMGRRTDSGSRRLMSIHRQSSDRGSPVSEPDAAEDPAAELRRQISRSLNSPEVQTPSPQARQASPVASADPGATPSTLPRKIQLGKLSTKVPTPDTDGRLSLSPSLFARDSLLTSASASASASGAAAASIPSTASSLSVDLVTRIRERVAQRVRNQNSSSSPTQQDSSPHDSPDAMTPSPSLANTKRLLSARNGTGASPDADTGADPGNASAPFSMVRRPSLGSAKRMLSTRGTRRPMMATSSPQEQLQRLKELHLGERSKGMSSSVLSQDSPTSAPSPPPPPAASSPQPLPPPLSARARQKLPSPPPPLSARTGQEPLSDTPSSEQVDLGALLSLPGSPPLSSLARQSGPAGMPPKGLYGGRSPRAAPTTHAAPSADLVRNASSSPTRRPPPPPPPPESAHAPSPLMVSSAARERSGLPHRSPAMLATTPVTPEVDAGQRRRPLRTLITEIATALDIPASSSPTVIARRGLQEVGLSETRDGQRLSLVQRINAVAEELGIATTEIDK